MEQPYLNVDTDIFYGDLSDHTRHILVQLDDLKEIVEGFAETQASLAAYRNNDITRTLTVAATILLPFLAVSSLYGMNVPLPLKDEPAAFIILLGAMAAISAAMLIFFRWRHWL